MGTDLSLIGFGEDELASLLADGTEGLTDPDDVPEVPAEPVSRAGDAWILGRHRLVCGDCTDAAVVAQALDGVTPHLMVTDPPYGVAYDPAWRNRAGLSATRRTGRVENDDRADWREAWALFPGEVAYVWHGALHAAAVAESLEACGFAIRAQIVWAKDRLVLGRGHYHWQHEPCWYAVQGRRALERRPQADDALADRQPRPGRRYRARHAEAGGVHAPADREQLVSPARRSTSPSPAPARRSSPPR